MFVFKRYNDEHKDHTQKSIHVRLNYEILKKLLNTDNIENILYVTDIAHIPGSDIIVGPYAFDAIQKRPEIIDLSKLRR